MFIINELLINNVFIISLYIEADLSFATNFPGLNPAENQATCIFGS